MINLLDNPFFTDRLKAALKQRADKNAASPALKSEFSQLPLNEQEEEVSIAFGKMRAHMCFLVALDIDPVELLRQWVESEG